MDTTLTSVTEVRTLFIIGLPVYFWNYSLITKCPSLMSLISFILHWWGSTGSNLDPTWYEEGVSDKVAADYLLVFFFYFQKYDAIFSWNCMAKKALLKTKMINLNELTLNPGDVTHWDPFTVPSQGLQPPQVEFGGQLFHSGVSKALLWTAPLNSAYVAEKFSLCGWEIQPHFQIPQRTDSVNPSQPFTIYPKNQCTLFCCKC